MILNPAIIALIGGGLLVSAFALYAAYNGLLIIRHWDLDSGSERQLLLERKTYLISTIFGFLLVFEFASLFLFAYTADHMHDLFVGAMCAAGSLNVNDYGYSTLVVKIITFLLCGVWAIVNYTDNQAADYPMIRAKYKLLLYVTGALLLETFLQCRYFLSLEADVITSCCGTLFSLEAQTVSGDLSALPPYGTMVVFYVGVALTIRAGVHFLFTGRASGPFAIFAATSMVLGFMAVISCISVYYYELPTHHCPFCILQKEYGYIGYPLYFSLFLSGISGLGVGVVERNKGGSSGKSFQRIQKRLTVLCIGGYLLFSVIAAYPMIFSDFVLE
ncbi:MAG: hypothetical protein CVU57_13865 [Deltaproteobacteria bacterium HGW-Deltaproteobacteria-15]|jgi:hypothetical protein|nr:MAG: hypothetical protein CVU57_13865 [Deltaproteobacteria bacterium HGW-Deltaproteobacteria-15]